MRLGVIGTGTIASAVVEGIAGDGHEIRVSERSPMVSARLARDFGVAVAENQAVVERAEVVVLGLMADVAPGVLGALRFRAGQRVISLMAGVTLAEVAAMVAPARAEVVMIPFPAIARGGSPVLSYPVSGLVEALFGARNRVFGLAHEGDLQSYLAVQAILSPVVRMLAEATEWTAARTGNAAEAEQFLRLLVGGGLMAEPADGEGVLDRMLAALNTPGGLNATLREHLGAAGAYEALRQGFDALEARLKG